MNDQSNKVLATIVDEFLMLVHETSEYHHGREDVQAVLREVILMLRSMRRRVLIASDRYIVAVVGLTNVGKSTLLNALFGEELAPRRNGPCTAAPIEFIYGRSLRVSVCQHNSISRPTWNCRSTEELHSRIADLADEGTGPSDRAVLKVIVEAPIQLLTNGLVIADTPGFGAAQVGQAIGSHEVALRSYLTKAVSQVFWVVLAEQGIGKREKSFHDSLFAEVCDDIVVTGCEDWEQTDRIRFKQRFAEVLDSRMPRFHFVSGLDGVRARQTHDLGKLEAAGIPLLEERIREVADYKGRMETIREAVLQVANDLGDWLSEYRDNRHERLATWWRPDSWSRWRARTPECPMKKEMTHKLSRAQ